MPTVLISKTEAAQRQLDTAIRLYFHYDDVVSIHTLAAATREVLEDPCKYHGIEHPVMMGKLIKTYIKNEHQKAVYGKFVEAENFFKHADRDPDATLEFPPAATEHMLFECVESYASLTQSPTDEMQAMKGWWMLENSDCISEDAPAAFKDGIRNFEYDPKDRTGFFDLAMEAARLRKLA